MHAALKNLVKNILRSGEVENQNITHKILIDLRKVCEWMKKFSMRRDYNLPSSDAQHLMDKIFYLLI